ncbi:MAG: DUF2232 domain-containing protein [Deltaproteobacteria bacterium]|nr:DUF2232 domain-containing protein [Deltaproteobacteria bacterium]MBW2142867.1 DUF2232 domain-containing protein [Deltaproteobacteria bacterium]
MKKTDVLGCVGLAAFILFASALIPLFGPFFCLLTPLPFLFYSTKLGLQEGIKLALLAILGIGLIAKLAGQPQIILFGIELSALGLALSELFRRRLGVGQTILFATLFMILLSLGYLFILGLSKGMGPFEMMLDYLYGHLKVTIEAYETMGMPLENVAELEKYGKAFIDTVYPSLMIIGVGFAVWLNVIMARPVFRMGNLRYPEFIPLDRWQTPEGMIWGVIVSGFALFLLPGVIQSLAANVLIVLMVIYLFHGLSIILFFLNKYRLPSWVRIGVYFLIVVQQLFLLLLAFAGLFDQWVDFRKLRRESES